MGGHQVKSIGGVKPPFADRYPDTGESGEAYEAEMNQCERCKGSPAIGSARIAFGQMTTVTNEYVVMIVNAALCKNCYSELKGLERHAELLRELVVDV